MILREAAYTTNELVAFYIIIPDKNDNHKGEISFMQVFDEGKGIGRMLLEKESAEYKLYVNYSTEQAQSFWKKMNINVLN